MALIGSLDSGVSAMQAFTTAIDVIGNNIANVNTDGYKTEGTQFSDTFSNVLYQSSGSVGSAPSSLQIGTGSRVSSTTSNFAQGSVSSTGINTDLAIDGNGFFQVVNPTSGIKYVTRAGDFTTDDSANILTPNGQQLQGLTGGNITYTVTEVGGSLVFTPSKTAPTGVGSLNASFTTPTVNSGLTVVTSGAGAVNPSDFSSAQINAAAPQLSGYGFDSTGNLTLTLSNGDSFIKGQVLLTSFDNPNALVKAGDNLYTNMSAAGPLAGTTTLSAVTNKPGTNGLGTFDTSSVELSNVDLTAQFAQLITTERSFQAASRIITVSDDVLQEVVNLKR